jgi:hypothetical protein
MAHGDISTADAVATGNGSIEAYELLEQVPPLGKARAAAWCAFVYQSFAGELLSSGPDEGFASPRAVEHALRLFEFAAYWLNLAREFGSDPARQRDVSFPQPLPRPPEWLDDQELAALKKTLEAAQAWIGSDLAARDDETRERLQPSMRAIQSALDSAAGLGSHSRALEVRASLAQTLQSALDRAFFLGQLLALPELADGDGGHADAPAAPTSFTVGLFRPGDQGFDPWCLTDPLERRARRDSAAARRALDELWQTDPKPERTLALQADILAAIESGAADYFPSDMPGTLGRIGAHCPWPGIVFARAGVSVGGTWMEAGDRWILAVGGTAGEFTRALVRISGKAVAEALALEPPPPGVDVRGLVGALAALMFDVIPY